MNTRFCSLLIVVLMMSSCKGTDVENNLKSDELEEKMMEGYGQEKIDFNERRGGMPEIKR